MSQLVRFSTKIGVLYKAEILEFDWFTVTSLVTKTRFGVVLLFTASYYPLCSAVRAPCYSRSSQFSILFSFSLFNPTEVTVQTGRFTLQIRLYLSSRAPSNVRRNACGCSQVDTTQYKGTNYFRTNYFRKQLAPCNTIRTHKLSAPIDNIVQNFRSRIMAAATPKLYNGPM